MSDIQGPYVVRAQVNNPYPQVPPFTVQIPNPTNVVAIRLMNKGPFDISFSGFGINGTEWLPSNSYIMLYGGAFNQGYITMLCQTIYTIQSIPVVGWPTSTTNQDVNTGKDVAGAFAMIFITKYYADDKIPEDVGIQSVASSNMWGNCQFSNFVNVGGTTVVVPYTPGGIPAQNVPVTYILGFDLTTGSTTTPTAGDLVINNLATQRDGSNSLNYRLKVESSGTVHLSVRYPGVGIVNAVTTVPQPVNFVVPPITGATINLCVYYTWIPYYG